MPKRTDINKLLILGSGPIVIGQACEFDYSGTQACKALREEGYEVILVNSNPATIMTDPDTAHKVYVEPLETQWLEKVIEKERPDALVPTLGGQTALNAAIKLSEAGILKKYGVELLGASVEAINKAEDRELFKEVMRDIGADVAKSFTVHTMEEGKKAAQELGFPLVLRPSFTLGGSGGGIAYNEGEFEAILTQGLMESPTTEVLVEESALGWKEFELEVMRDQAGTFVVICTIENFDPMGVHTGDSITVAPAMTLTDAQYQAMRDEGKKIIDAIGVATGGANIQFAVEPKTGRRIVIEMNPRVSRSSALASKATGFPIAKIAAKLAVGYELHEIINDITKTTPCSFEPTIDYVVTKVPRFNFEKFGGVRDSLTTQMKSIGEVMGIGRTFRESFQKALASLERGAGGLEPVTLDERKLIEPNSQRLFHVAQAYRDGWTLEKLHDKTKIDPWFLNQLKILVDLEKSVNNETMNNKESLHRFKKEGFSDRHLAYLADTSPEAVRKKRHELGVRPGYCVVDTCAGEFASTTPYYYSTYHKAPEKSLEVSDGVVVLGSGPNRIGQAIEFDYSCVQGVKAIRENGYKAIMINSNPETVSTDYDTSNYLFFEPLNEEHVLEVLDFVKPMGVCVQLGGQTPINLATHVERGGYKILGSSLGSIEGAEDRHKFSQICGHLELKLPKHRTAQSGPEAIRVAQEVGFPIICRPSFVLGGSRMEIFDEISELENYLGRFPDVMGEGRPLLIDQFLENALEVDVDMICDGETAYVGGIIEHIERAGVHSGDSMGVLPPQKLKPETIKKIEEVSKDLCLALKIVGCLNLQLAIKNDEVFVLEANPRSSRSIPFVAKATEVPLVKLAMACMLGKKLTIDRKWSDLESISVKGVVFPFKKFSDLDLVLGPEMRSTGETMGRAVKNGDSPASYSEALEKAFVSCGLKIPDGGRVLFSINDKKKEESIPLAKMAKECGYKILATGGTADFFKENGIEVTKINKVRQGSPHCVDIILAGQTQLVINTTSGARSTADSFSLRRSCTEKNIPCLTEMAAAQAFLQVLASRKTGIAKPQVSHLGSARGSYYS